MGLGPSSSSSPYSLECVKLEFSEVALLRHKHPQGMLRVAPKGIMEAPGRSYLEKGEVHPMPYLLVRHKVEDYER
jgi:hypothetical protein